MTLLKADFIELLIGFVEGDEECVNAMTDAYTKLQRLWGKGEWVYVKDIEMSLKEIFKMHQRGEFGDFRSVKECILNEEGNMDSISDPWVKEQLRSCRFSLSQLRLADL